MRITKKDITDYLDLMIDRGAAGNTINVHVNALKFLFTEILRRRLMLWIRYSKKPKTMPVFLSKEEIIRLFAAVDNPKHRMILELLYSAGLRVSEVVNLKKQDFDFSRGIGWVRHGKGAKDRPFIIARCLAPRLKAHIDYNCKDSDCLFIGRKRVHLHIRSVQEIVKQAACKAGIHKKIHPHSLRHSFATHLIENGYDVCAVQPLLGHSNADTTMVYVHMASPALLSVKSPYDSLLIKEPVMASGEHNILDACRAVHERFKY